MLRHWPWVAAIASGGLLTLSLPTWNYGWLCWIALIPLITGILFDRTRPLAPITPSRIAVSRKRGMFRRVRDRWGRFSHHPVGRAFLLGYVTGLVFFWTAFSWLTTVTEPGWFLLGFYMALYPALWGALLARAGRHAGDFTRSVANLRVAAIGAAGWTALEWLRGWLFTGFGWNNLGTALYDDLAFIQIVEYTGVGGLSFMLTFTNLIAVITVKRFIREIAEVRIRPHWDFSVAMVMVAGVFLFGVRALFGPKQEGMIPLRVAAVQPNIPQNEKFDRAHEKRIFERLTFLTESALAWEPDLLIWPEAATPQGMFADGTNFAFVHGFAARGDFNFLLGTLDYDAEQRDYNIAALLTGKGERVQIYRKNHLVPFGEYIPFRHSFPLFAWIVGDLVPSDFTPGTTTEPLELENPSIKAGVLICFEDTVGRLTRRFVEAGAQCLINVTNDGWFLESAASRQHLANAVFRAVENRRPLLRCANTGVSAFIDPYGRITRQFDDPFAEGVLADVVQIPPPTAPQTFYTRHGEFFSIAALFATVLWLGCVTLGQRRQRRHEPSPPRRVSH